MLWYIYVQKIQYVIAEIFVLPFIWAVFLLIFWKWKRFLHCVCIALSVCSVAGILYTTLANRGGGSEVSLIPFMSFVQAQKQREIYRSMLMNMLLFEPLGLCLPLALPKRYTHKVRTAILFAFMLSVFIEASQFFFRLGLCETDDVIMNTLGAALGCCAFGMIDFSERLIRFIKRKEP